jgi:hypothetical protein
MLCILISNYSYIHGLSFIERSAVEHIHCFARITIIDYQNSYREKIHNSQSCKQRQVNKLIRSIGMTYSLLLPNVYLQLQTRG